MRVGGLCAQYDGDADRRVEPKKESHKNANSRTTLKTKRELGKSNLRKKKAKNLS